MSARQREVLAGWKRPSELFSGLWQHIALKPEESLMRAKSYSDLVQDITTDCSVVASLCAAMKQMQPGDRSASLTTFLSRFNRQLTVDSCCDT